MERAAGSGRCRTDHQQCPAPVLLWKPPEPAVRWCPEDLWLVSGRDGPICLIRQCLPEWGLRGQDPRGLGQHPEAVGRGDRGHRQQSWFPGQWLRPPHRDPRAALTMGRELKGWIWARVGSSLQMARRAGWRDPLGLGICTGQEGGGLGGSSEAGPAAVSSFLCRFPLCVSASVSASPCLSPDLSVPPYL